MFIWRVTERWRDRESSIHWCTFQINSMASSRLAKLGPCEPPTVAEAQASSAFPRAIFCCFFQAIIRELNQKWNGQHSNWHFRVPAKLEVESGLEPRHSNKERGHLKQQLNHCTTMPTPRLLFVCFYLKVRGTEIICLLVYSPYAYGSWSWIKSKSEAQHLVQLFCLKAGARVLVTACCLPGCTVTGSWKQELPSAPDPSVQDGGIPSNILTATPSTCPIDMFVS